MYSHILLPTDGSEFARQGVEKGLGLAKALGCAVTIVTANEPDAVSEYGKGWLTDPEGFRRYETDLRRAAESALADAAEAARAAGIAVETLYVPDRAPAAAILETAERVGADLIVMASHGRRGLQRVLLGSQTREVLTRSPVPVLVAR